MMLLDVIDGIDELNAQNKKIGFWDFNAVHVLNKDSSIIWFNYGGIRRRKEFRWNDETSKVLNWIVSSEKYLRHEDSKMFGFDYHQNFNGCYAMERKDYYVEVFSNMNPVISKRNKKTGEVFCSIEYDNLEVMDALIKFEREFNMGDFEFMAPSLRDWILKHETA